MPIQGIFKPETEALVEFKQEFSKGFKDIEGHEAVKKRTEAEVFC